MRTDHANGSTASLSVNGLKGWYGESHVLHDVNFKVATGEVVTLIGRNGAGKSTTLKAIMGLLRKREGSIQVNGSQVIDMQPHRIARLGIGFVPENRGIFSSLSVEENLLLPPKLASGGMTLERIFQLFPNLKERASSQGTKLSGGEQQMLAIARILRTGVKLILLDEPTEGLAPVIVDQIGVMLHELKSEGYTIVLVEQNFHFASRIADRHYVVEEGCVVDTILNDEMGANLEKLRKYVGV